MSVSTSKDAADFGCGEEDVVGLFCCEEGFDGGLVSEVEFGVGAGEEVGVNLTLSPALSPRGRGGGQVAHEGGANQTAMASDVDFGGGVHAFVNSAEISLCSQDTL